VLRWNREYQGFDVVRGVVAKDIRKRGVGRDA